MDEPLDGPRAPVADVTGTPAVAGTAPLRQSLTAREGLPSSRRHYLNVLRPIRRGVLQRLHFQVFSAFHGLHPDLEGLGSP